MGRLTVVCCLRVRYDGRRQQESSLHRLRPSHVIASGVDVRCTVTDTVSDTASTPVVTVSWRSDACNCLIVYCVLLYDVIACVLGLVVTDCTDRLTVFSRPVIF